MKRFRYENLYVPLQNLLCTAYGIRQRYQMYGGDFEAHYRQFRNHESASPEAIDSMQLDRLRRIIGMSVSKVPYYRERRLDYAGSSQPIGWEEFRQFPLLDKENVRTNPEQFVNGHASRMQTMIGRTSGTTGTPMRITTTYDAFRQAWAAMERMRAWACVSRFHRRASLTGKVFVPTTRDPKGAYWRYDWMGKRILLSVYHLNEATVPLYVVALSKFRPVFIDGYPSAIVRIAEYLLAHPSQRIPSLVAAFPTAETLTSGSRRIIEEGLGVKVFNQYGSTELSCHAADCEYGSMHISPEIGIIEILDDEGKSVQPGDLGNVVLTGLVNHGMPLIRYKIGDMAIAPQPGAMCRCGRSLPLLGDIAGRNDDLVKTPDGRALAIMNYHVFKVASGIKEGQLIQDDYQNFRMVVVPDHQRDPDLKGALHELNARLGYEANVEIVVTDSIERTSAGKLRSVISHVG